MKKSILFAAIFAFLAVLLLPGMSQAYSFLPAPTLLAPASGESFDMSKPAIRGVTFNDTRVAIYIDDAFNGYANVQNGSQGTASFVYFPFLDLNAGWHKVKVRAEDPNTGVRSDVSPETSFFIEFPYPAPEVHYAAVNGDTTWSKPFIAGVAKNDSTVQVFIDGALNGEFKVMNSGTGTASFAYQPYCSLSPGTHTAYAVAVSPEGKKSVASAVLTFEVVKPEQATVSSTVVSEEASADENEAMEALEENLTEALPAEAAESEEAAEVVEEAAPAEKPTGGEEASQEAAEEEGEADAAEAEEEEGEAEEEGEEGKKKSSTIGWILLALIAAALVWRNRKGFSSMVKGGKQPPEDSAGIGPDESDNKSVEVISGGEDKDDNGPSENPENKQ